MKAKSAGKTERDKRMDALASRLSKQLDGANLFEAASVCSMLAAWSIREIYPTRDTRMQALGAMWQFMTEVVTKNEDGQTSPWHSNGE